MDENVASMAVNEEIQKMVMGNGDEIEHEWSVDDLIKHVSLLADDEYKLEQLKKLRSAIVSKMQLCSPNHLDLWFGIWAYHFPNGLEMIRAWITEAHGGQSHIVTIPHEEGRSKTVCCFAFHVYTMPPADLPDPGRLVLLDKVPLRKE